VEVAHAARRPWSKDTDDEDLEMRHQQLFDILANVRMQRYYDTELDAWCVPDFTLKLSWNPEDVLLGAVPFRISYRSSDEISAAMDKLPEKKEKDLYD
jgi:hypothetical protein